MSQEELNHLANYQSDEFEHDQIDWALVEIIESERGRLCPR